MEEIAAPNISLSFSCRSRSSCGFGLFCFLFLLDGFWFLEDKEFCVDVDVDVDEVVDDDEVVDEVVDAVDVVDVWSSWFSESEPERKGDQVRDFVVAAFSWATNFARNRRQSSPMDSSNKCSVRARSEFLIPNAVALDLLLLVDVELPIPSWPWPWPHGGTKPRTEDVSAETITNETTVRKNDFIVGFVG